MPQMSRAALRARSAALGGLLAAMGEEEGAQCAGVEQGLWACSSSLHDAHAGVEASTEDDWDLARSCAAVAFELRARQWSALERLLALADLGDGPTLGDRLLSLPESAMSRAVLDTMTLGWWADAPVEEEGEAPND